QAGAGIHYRYFNFYHNTHTIECGIQRAFDKSIMTTNESKLHMYGGGEESADIMSLHPLEHFLQQSSTQFVRKISVFSRLLNILDLALITERAHAAGLDFMQSISIGQEQFGSHRQIVCVLEIRLNLVEHELDLEEMGEGQNVPYRLI
ncbi:hypothetical protein PFISCL1PPCAC_20650, partial [Pristionchus fissidentatus]